jgi:myosin heavy subunit
MARKRLSDLLREEANKPEKPTDPIDASDSPPTAKPTANRRKKSTPPQPLEAAAHETTVEITATIVNDAAPTTAAAPFDASEVAQSPPDAAQLALIHDLKAALEAAQQREQSLQQQVTDLQTQLQAQAHQIQTLQTELEKTAALKADLDRARAEALQLAEANEKAEALKAELDRTKADAIHLAEANTQLTQELEALKQPAPKQPPAETAAPTTRSLAKKETLLQQQARSLSHPVFPDKPAAKPSGEPDIGWMD